MIAKIVCPFSLAILLTLSSTCIADQESGLGQSIEINTFLHSIEGRPSWLLILRNEQTGQVLPYQFDFKNFNNTWVAFSFGNTYRVTVSQMQFDSQNTLYNFCNLEGGVLQNTSMSVRLNGNLNLNGDYECHVLKFKNYSFPIVVPEPEEKQNSSLSLNKISLNNVPTLLRNFL